MIKIIRRLKTLNFRKYLKSLLYKLIGWIGDSDIETRKALSRFDYLNKLFLVSLCGGQKQEYDKPITRKVWIANWIARITVIYSVIRVILFIYSEGNEQMDLYLANLIPEDAQPMKTSFFILTIITFCTFFALREYIHYNERCGYLISLRGFADIRIHGVSRAPLMLNKRCEQLFSKVCHLFIVNGIRILIFICTYTLSFTLILRLYFPSTYSTKMHIFFMVLHIVIETVAMITLFSALINIGVYCWTLTMLYTSGMDSVIDQIKYCLFKAQLSQVELREINKQVILVLNYTDQINRHMNYLILYLDVLIAVEADLLLLFSLIFNLFPDFISKIITFGGILIHFFLVIGNYWGSRYYVKVLSVHGYYTKLILNTRIICSARFKALEIQDRINGNQTGIAIGDFGFITPRFPLIFILENINLIMLLTCNINSLIDINTS